MVQFNQQLCAWTVAKLEWCERRQVAGDFRLRNAGVTRDLLTVALVGGQHLEGIALDAGWQKICVSPPELLVYSGRGVYTVVG